MDSVICVKRIFAKIFYEVEDKSDKIITVIYVNKFKCKYM
jgi:hypothetical protein